MAKRKPKRRERTPKPTVDYTDPEGNVLTLRESLSRGTIRKISSVAAKGGASIDDAWHRRTEMLFERLVVRWEIAGAPLEDQKMLLARYRIADTATQNWVRGAIAQHLEHYIPELRDASG
jgi:hypothetical protein